MTESSPLPALRARFAGFEAVTPPARFALGAAGIDAALGGGPGLARLHEIWPEVAADMASATGFALMLAARAGGTHGNIVWIAEAAGERRRGPIHPPGLAELGIDPARLLFVSAPDARTLLRAAGDVARSPAAGTMVIAPADAKAGFDLTATRRLTLFAEASGVTAILIRPGEPDTPSAAATRWRVAAAPSTALEADAPGHPAFTVEVPRQRGGAPVPAMRLEWDRDAGCFADLSRALPADAGGGYLAGVG